MAGHRAETEPNPANARDRNRVSIFPKGPPRADFSPCLFFPLTVSTPSRTTPATSPHFAPLLSPFQQPQPLYFYCWQTSGESSVVINRSPLLLSTTGRWHLYSAKGRISERDKDENRRVSFSVRLVSITSVASLLGRTFDMVHDQGEKFSSSFNIALLILGCSNTETRWNRWKRVQVRGSIISILRIRREL